MKVHFKKDKFESTHSKFNYECPIVDQVFKHLKGFQSKHLAKNFKIRSDLHKLAFHIHFKLTRIVTPFSSA